MKTKWILKEMKEMRKERLFARIVIKGVIKLRSVEVKMFCQTFQKIIVKKSNVIECYDCELMGNGIGLCRVKKCKYCQQLGHLEEICWNKTDKPQKDVVNNDGKIKCYNCGKYVHMARSCFNKAVKPILKRVNFNDKAIDELIRENLLLNEYL